MARQCEAPKTLTVISGTARRSCRRTAQSSVIAAQAEVGVKTNEVPMATEVLGQIDLHGTLVSADALQR